MARWRGDPRRLSRKCSSYGTAFRTLQLLQICFQPVASDDVAVCLDAAGRLDTGQAFDLGAGRHGAGAPAQDEHGHQDDGGAGRWLDFAQAHGQATGDGADDGHGDEQVNIDFHAAPPSSAARSVLKSKRDIRASAWAWSMPQLVMNMARISATSSLSSGHSSASSRAPSLAARMMGALAGRATTVLAHTSIGSRRT